MSIFQYWDTCEEPPIWVCRKVRGNPPHVMLRGRFGVNSPFSDTPRSLPDSQRPDKRHMVLSSLRKWPQVIDNLTILQMDQYHASAEPNWAVSKTLLAFLLTLKSLSRLLSRLFRGLRFGFREGTCFLFSFRGAFAAIDFCGYFRDPVATLSRPACWLSRTQQS